MSGGSGSMDSCRGHSWGKIAALASFIVGTRSGTVSVLGIDGRLRCGGAPTIAADTDVELVILRVETVSSRTHFRKASEILWNQPCALELCKAANRPNSWSFSGVTVGL